MRRRVLLAACAAALVLGGLGDALVAGQRAGRGGAPARQPPPAGEQEAAAAAAAAQGRSPRNANYSIDVELDPASRTVTGRQVLTWRNITRQPTSELRFHLYWNAWANTESTWMRGLARAAADPLYAGARRPGSRFRDPWGWIDITAIRLLGTAPAPITDLTGAGEFIAPDDGNADDRTLLRVPLPRAVAPGESIALEMAWTSRVPRTFARTGVIGRFFFLAHWFPKVAVLEDSGWNAHQFHFATEFFADYGSYDVRITVPQGWVVGATGREQQRLDGPGGRTTHRYVQDDVHDFAWTTGPALIEVRDRFEHAGLPPVDLRLLLQPEHAGQADRHFVAAKATLLDYGQWFGAYPYGHLTIVDPAWGSGAGGMEYPTLVTAGTRWLAPRGVLQPESVTIHEVGHQFWYGLVGSNEFEHAWLDEGVNSYAQGLVIERGFEPHFVSERFFGGFVPWVYRDIPITRAEGEPRRSGYLRAPATDVPATPTWQYSPGTAAIISYHKTALWLQTLERMIGWPALQRGLALFFERHTFRHPTPADFFAAVGEGAGTDLGWFFDEVHGTARVVDYGVERLTSERQAPAGYALRDGSRVPLDDRRATAETYTTELVVRRHGDAVLPVDIIVRFADGYEVEARWDGREAWRLWRWERAARAVSAEVDPQRVLLLDVNLTNNSYTLQPERHRAARAWAARWMIWLQDALITWTSMW
jgi:hypothetical protein